MVTAGVINGFGKHTKAIDPSKLETVLLLNNISFLTGILSFTIPKLGIAALLNRILNRSKFQQIMLWFLTGFAAVVSCICIVILFTMCDPPDAMWKPWLLEQGATCRDQMILVVLAIFTGSECSSIVKTQNASNADAAQVSLDLSISFSPSTRVPS